MVVLTCPCKANSITLISIKSTIEASTHKINTTTMLYRKIKENRRERIKKMAKAYHRTLCKKDWKKNFLLPVASTCE